MLPDYDVLIVDEAHHLEDEATQQLGWRIGERELLSRLERLWSPGGGGSGAVPEALALIGAANGMLLPPALRPTVERRRAGGAAARHVDPALLRGSGAPARGSRAGQRRAATTRRCASPRACARAPAWQELEHVWAEAVGHEQIVERAIIEVTAELEALARRTRCGARPGAPSWAASSTTGAICGGG